MRLGASIVQSYHCKPSGILPGIHDPPPPDTVTVEGYEYKAKVNDQDVAQDDGTRAFVRDVLLNL